MPKHTDNKAGSKSCREDATRQAGLSTLRGCLLETSFFSKCSSNCIQKPKHNPEFKDTASYPGPGNTPPCISNIFSFFYSPCAHLALPLKTRLAREHLNICHKEFCSLQFCWGPSALPSPQQNGAGGAHKGGCRTQRLCQHLKPTFCYLFSPAFFHSFLVGKTEDKHIKSNEDGGSLWEKFKTHVEVCHTWPL